MSTSLEPTAKLSDDDLDTILTIAQNGQSGRITKYEITELIDGYRALDSLQAQVEVQRRALQSVHRLMASADTDSMDNDEDAALFMAVRWQVSCALTQSSDAEMGEKT